MKCPECGTWELGVMDTRPIEDGACVRRRRICENGHRFTTYERLGRSVYDSRHATDFVASMTNQIAQLAETVNRFAAKGRVVESDSGESEDSP